MNWIDCNVRTPETPTEGELSTFYSDDVLILNQDGNCYVARFELRIREKKETYWLEQSSGCGCCADIMLPTHWMPIPAAPEKNK